MPDKHFAVFEKVNGKIQSSMITHTQYKNPYRQQEKADQEELGFKTRKAYLKAMKKQRIKLRKELL